MSTPADAEPAAYAPTASTTPTRARERVRYERELVHSILDEGYVCHLGLVRDGTPLVLPTLYARVGERLYIHGSTGSRPLREASGRAEGVPVCLTVTLVDGLVLARAAFHHSINYRSVVVRGTAHQVTGPQERAMALDALVESVVPGRSRDARPADAKELAATEVLRVDLTEVSAKVREGDPKDDEDDLGLAYWSGVVPVRSVRGTPVPAGDLAPGIPTPGYLA